MNRTIIAVILGALVLVLIGFLFIGDAQDTTVLKIGDKSYSIDDFKSYVRVWNYENEDSKDLKLLRNLQNLVQDLKLHLEIWKYVVQEIF